MAQKKMSIALPSMTPGTRRTIVYHRFGRTGARPKAYLQAAIHANEFPGSMALHHLMPMMAEADRLGKINGEIVIVPAVNPIGMSQVSFNHHLGRYDFFGRDNFNRNWHDLSGAVADRVGAKLGRNARDNIATIRAAALTTLRAMKPVNELQVLRTETMKLSIDADIVLDLHCDSEAALHLFVSRQDWPGDAQVLAADLGVEATLYNDPYPTTLTFFGANSGLWPRLAERFPDADIPQACLAATIEYRSEHEVSHTLGKSDARNLYRFLVRRGLIAGRAGPPPRLKAPGTPIGGMDVGYCPKPGILVYHLAKGARVRKGMAVCEVIDPMDPRGPKARTQIFARTDGILFSRKQAGTLAWPGKVAFRIAGARLLAHRKGQTGLDD